MKAGLMLGVNPNAKREENDFYATNPIALKLFLENYKQLNKMVWECSCGQGHLSKKLEEQGYDVFSSDLIDRGYGITPVNFLEQDDIKIWNGDILTNPPFNLAEDFLKKGMEILGNGNKIILFLKIQFLEGQSRKKLFEIYPPKYVYCHSSRQQCAKDGRFDLYKATTQFYAWYVWEKGYSGDTIIKWI